MNIQDKLSITLDTLSMSCRQYAKLAKEKHWNIERALRGEWDLDSHDFHRLSSLCDDLIALQESFPIDLDWSDSARILTVLAIRREQADRDTFLQKQAERRQRIQQLQQ